MFGSFSFLFFILFNTSKALNHLNPGSSNNCKVISKSDFIKDFTSKLNGTSIKVTKWPSNGEFEKIKNEFQIQIDEFLINNKELSGGNDGSKEKPFSTQNSSCFYIKHEVNPQDYINKYNNNIITFLKIDPKEFGPIFDQNGKKEKINSFCVENYNNGLLCIIFSDNVVYVYYNLPSSLLSDVTVDGFRQKRSSPAEGLVNALASGSGAVITEDMANTLLRAYDLLVSNNQQMEVLYLNNINDLLSGFCIQTDTTRIMQASGNKYTDIKLQGLIPSYKTFLTDKYSMAACTDDSILFDQTFEDAFSNWKCANGTITCTELCLGTGRTKKSVLTDNQYLEAVFTAPPSHSLVNLVSDLHIVAFMDPVNGKEVNLPSSVQYTVRIPLLNYTTSLYYKCNVYDDEWDDDACFTAEYASGNANDGYKLECSCRVNGFIGVFIIAPPTPIDYPAYNEIKLGFGLAESNNASVDDAQTFINKLSALTLLDVSRFVKVSSVVDGRFNATLRPSFRLNQTTNSYAIQAIKRVIHVPGGYGSLAGTVCTTVLDQVVTRAMTNDGNARRVSLKIDKTLKQTVGNNSDGMAKAWLSFMATNMRISEFRFKLPTIHFGVLYNFTITLPYPAEPIHEKDLSAEEISLWIQEQVKYNELVLENPNKERLPIDPLTDEDIYTLVVAQKVNVLVVTLSVIVAVICILGTLCVGGLVFIKVRTDRLIESHNDEVVEMPMTIFPTEPTPISTATLSSDGSEIPMDTIVFRRN